VRETLVRGVSEAKDRGIRVKTVETAKDLSLDTSSHRLDDKSG